MPELVGALPDLIVTIDEITEDADGVRVSVGLEGTHRSELWGSPATGAKVRFDVPLTPARHR